MAARARAAATAMAALDRRLPSLDDFVGQSWTAWADRAGVGGGDGSEPDDHGQKGKKAADAMSLCRDDMSIFGLCPGLDDFYLVVCGACGRLVKPQAFEQHCERRHGHGPPSRQHVRPRPLAPLPPPHRPLQAPPPARPASPWEGRAGGAAQAWPSLGSPGSPAPHRPGRSCREGERPPPPDKPSSFRPPVEPSITPSPALRDPPWPHGGATAGRPAPTDRPPVQKKEVTPPAGPRPPRPYNKVASRRECDLDKHCGVLDPDRKKVCTRLLTCNIHSIHQRRKVPGRSRTFDQLVSELKTRVRERGVQLLLEGGSVSADPPKEREREPERGPACRRPLAVLPADRDSAAQEDMALPSSQAPPPPPHGPISSEESDGDQPDDPPEFCCSASHPRPAAVCSFGGRWLGHGVFTFDRRLHHLRSALSSMLEQHLNAHLWRRIPQAADPAPPPPLKVRTGSHLTLTTSPGRLPPPVPRHDGIKVRPGRSGRRQLPPPSGPARNCTPAPSVASPTQTHVRTNGALSPGSKPRPHPSPSDCAPYRRPSEPGLLKRRRAAVPEEPRPAPTTPQTHTHTPAHTRPNFYTWKDGRAGLDRKLSAQKPKVHP